jgi:3-deoxy-D-manno-octulosonic acid kinase
MTQPRTLALHTPRGVQEGYETRSTASTRAVVWKGAGGWLDSVLASGATLHEWARSQEDRAEFPGRGRVCSVAAPAAGPDGRERWAVRHFQRGGAVASHMEDRYLRVGRPRPWREVAASTTARARGVRTPAVVCGIAYPDGAFYRADLVTEMIPNARTLADIMLGGDSPDLIIALARSGELIRRLADAGVFHVDLNARNILLTEEPGAEAFVIDLDRARILQRLSASARGRMQARLVRSIVKIGSPTGEGLGRSEIEAALNRLAESC